MATMLVKTQRFTTKQQKRLRLLLVEDNELIAVLAERQLRHLDVDCSRVSNGREAIAAATAGLYDLILMDVHMPELDGLAATRAIRQLELLKGRQRVPIVGVTAQASYRHCYDAGMDDCFPKPAQYADIVQCWLPKCALPAL